MRSTRFRTLLFLAVLPLLVGICVATLFLASMVIGDSARRDLEHDLDRAHRAFDDLQGVRMSLFDAQARVTAEEPRLKAVTAIEGVNRETVEDVSSEIHKLLGSDLFVIADATGRPITGPSPLLASDGLSDTMVAAALAKGHAAGVVVDRGDVHQVVSYRLEAGDRVLGALVTGYRVDDRMARTLYNQTGAGIAVLLDDRVVAAWPPSQRPALQALAARAPDASAEPLELKHAGERHLALVAAFPADPIHLGPHSLRYVALRSLDEAMAPARRLRILLVGLMAAALAIAVAISSRIARGLSSPIEALAALAARIGKGELDARASVRGTREILELQGAMDRMATELRASREASAVKERLEKELEIAARIQLSLLPKKLEGLGIDLSAAMHPASEVGGDYFDVLPELQGDGLWIAVGDVAGHGLTAGLVMLMVQSALASVVKSQRNVTPRQLLIAVNSVVHENVRDRLGRDEHVTMTVLHYRRDGRVAFAGAHEDILICRHATGRCEWIPTPGPWLAVMPEIADIVTESQVQLQPGDLMVLYSDGVTEARHEGLGYFGSDRLQAAVERHRHRPALEIQELVMAEVRAFASRQDDDMSLIVLRQP